MQVVTPFLPSIRTRPGLVDKPDSEIQNCSLMAHNYRLLRVISYISTGHITLLATTGGKVRKLLLLLLR